MKNGARRQSQGCKSVSNNLSNSLNKGKIMARNIFARRSYGKREPKELSERTGKNNSKAAGVWCGERQTARWLERRGILRSPAAAHTAVAHTAVARPAAHVIAAQLLRPLQQLLPGIFVPVFCCHGIFLQSQYLFFRGVSKESGRAKAPD